MSIPKETQRRVAYADLFMDHAFVRSVAYWRASTDTELRWSTVEKQAESMLIGSGDGLIVDGDCDATISAPDGGIVHITGNLNADLEPAGHYEVVIEGDVAAGAAIRARGFCHVYIGGTVYGSIESAGSAKTWVRGDFKGRLLTGHPSTRLVVSGEMVGLVRPLASGSILFLSVEGFAANDHISEIATIGYTLFHASVGSSDVEPGLYPKGDGRRQTEKGNSFFRWCVQSRRSKD